MTLHLSTEDYRLSIPSASDIAASNAPEVDNALLAPECLSDNTAPEVCPGQGPQVFYDTTSPEALQIRSSENTDQLPPDGSTSAHYSRKNLVFLSLTATILLGIALGIGLGLGLKGRGKGQTDQQRSIQPPIATPERILQHGILENTSIAAVTLPGDVRHVYFQETTGALRRAIYSAQANAWHMPIDDRVPFNEALPKNNTPLAAVTWPPSYGNDPQLVTLFYVNSETQTIDCRRWSQSMFYDCSGLESVRGKLSVSPLSRQISATPLVADADQASLLLTYQDTSARPVVMLGYFNATTNNEWIWRNETAKVEREMRLAEAIVAVACNAHAPNPGLSDESIALICFEKGVKGSVARTNVLRITVNKTSPGDIAFQFGESIDRSGHNFTSNQDSAMLGTGQILWFQGSALRMEKSIMLNSYPIPKSSFPFHRLASTPAENATFSYLYHQLSDSVFAEDLWDDTSQLWISKNFTIETS